jgi:hypothetical protein
VLNFYINCTDPSFYMLILIPNKTSRAVKSAGLQQKDLIVECNGEPVATSLQVHLCMTTYFLDIHSGVVFWHIKKFGQKNSAYVSTFYVLTKSFHEKPTYFVLCVKRQNLVLKNSFVRVNFFLSFLHKPQKMSVFL